MVAEILIKLGVSNEGRRVVPLSDPSRWYWCALLMLEFTLGRVRKFRKNRPSRRVLLEAGVYYPVGNLKKKRKRKQKKQ